MRSVEFLLSPRPPFRLDLTVWALRRRPDNVVDRWCGHVYRRVLPLASGPLEMAVAQVGSAAAPRLKVTLGGSRHITRAELVVSSALQRLLGLDSDLAPFYRFAARGRPMHALATAFRGMKPPRFASVFEGLINAIACQQLTMIVGIRLLNRLAQACGPSVRTGGATAYGFPRPQDVVAMSAGGLRDLGFSRQKARAVLELAGAAAEGRLDLESVAALPDREALEHLQRLRGVGRWTAEYVLLRGMGRLHVFPADDVGARNNLRDWLSLPEPLDYDGVGRALRRWRRFGGLLYFHLLMRRLAEAGYVDPNPPSLQASQAALP